MDSREPSQDQSAGIVVGLAVAGVVLAVGVVVVLRCLRSRSCSGQSCRCRHAHAHDHDHEPPGVVEEVVVEVEVLEEV